MEAAGSERKSCEIQIEFQLLWPNFKIEKMGSVFYSLWCVHGEATANLRTKKLEKSSHSKTQEDKYAVLCIG